MQEYGWMDRDADRLRELRRQREELTKEIEAIEATFKLHMEADGVEELSGDRFKITWFPVTSERVDVKALRAELPEIASRFLVKSTARRFVLA